MVAQWYGMVPCCAIPGHADKARPGEGGGEGEGERRRRRREREMKRD